MLKSVLINNMYSIYTEYICLKYTWQNTFRVTSVQSTAIQFLAKQNRESTKGYSR